MRNKHRLIHHYIDLITVLTQKDLKVRYKNSFLGYLWSIAHPLAFALVFFIAFKVVVKIRVENYTLFLISGLFPWQWFANSVNGAPMIFINNASIIKKVNFPKNVLVLTHVLQDMIHFLLAIPVIALFLIIYGKAPSVSWCYGIPILLFIQFFITYGLSIIVASTNLFFRDLERLTMLFTTLLFYFTPIIYPEHMIPNHYKPLIHLNPMASLMVSWRNLFMVGVLDIFEICLALVYAIIIFFLGHVIYKSLSWRFAEIL
ncbi:MAG TPA: ABC transporter permease [Syntrophorhabdaceae bacterium]|nr:ABC transporter permease [Syntrophorhabdaceae bacterium]